MAVALKVLLLAAACAAPVLWSALRERPPAPDFAGLLAQRDALAREIAALERLPAAAPVHAHKKTALNYFRIYRGLRVEFPVRARDKSDDSWRGRLSGPAPEALAAARFVQTLAPVRFERLSVKAGVASLNFRILGDAQ